MRYSAKNKTEATLRGRYHDYNSQRRNRNQTTVTWEKYKENTGNGSIKFSKGKSK